MMSPTSCPTPTCPSLYFRPYDAASRGTRFNQEFEGTHTELWIKVCLTGIGLPPVDLRGRQRSRRKAKPDAQLSVDPLGVTEGRLHAPRRGADAGVTERHGVARQGPEAPPQRYERGVVRREKVEDVIENVAPRHDKAELLQQSLEVG